MKEPEIDIKELFLLTERDFSQDPVPMQRKEFKIPTIYSILPALLGLSALFVLSITNSKLYEFAINSFIKFYNIYSKGVIEIAQHFTT